MADIPLPADIPFNAVLKRLETSNVVYLHKLDDVTEADKHWARLSGDPQRLDIGDLMYALAHPDNYCGITAVTEKIRTHLGFRNTDQLHFKTIALTPTQQVALTIITPTTYDATAPVLIFGTGLGHSSALSVPDMVRRAHRLHCRVVLFDQPGNGGSQSSTTVSSSDFYTALKAVIISEVPESGRYYAAGHSLGTNPLGQLYADIRAGNNPVGQRTLVRLLPTNPIPTRLQETSGTGKLARSFVFGQVGSEVMHGFSAMSVTRLSLFDNDHSAADRAKSRPLIERETQIPISTLGMLTILATMDCHDLTPHVGTDPRLAVVLGKRDQLMNWSTDIYLNKRGYHIVDGDHGACWIGEETSTACSLMIDHALTEAPDNKLPILTVDDVYQRWSGAINVGLQYGFMTQSPALAPEFSLKRGITTLANHLGLYVSGSVQVPLGYSFSRHTSLVAPAALATVGIEGIRQLPFDFKVGVIGGFNVNFLAAAGINIARAFDLEVQARTSLNFTFNDVIAALKIRFY